MGARIELRRWDRSLLWRYILAVMLLVMNVIGSMAQDIDQPSNVKYVGSLGGAIGGSVRVGRYVYAGQGCVLRVLDTLAPGGPHEVGRLILDEVINSMANKGPVLYIATRSFWSHYGDVKMIDLTDPVRPQLMESFYEETDRGKLIEIEIRGNALYVHSPRLSRYNILEPRHPVSNPIPRDEREAVAKMLDTTVTLPFDMKMHDTLRALPDFHETIALQVHGNCAYLLDWKAGLLVVDVSRPENPRLLGQCRLPVLGRCLALHGNVAVVGGCCRIVVLDIATPARPVIVGQYEINTIVNQVAFSGDMVCAAGGPIEMRLWRWGVVDFWRYKEEPPPGHNDWEAAMREVQNQKNMASGIWMLSLSDLAHPCLVSQYPTEKPCLDILTEKRRAFISGDGISILDLATPERPLMPTGIKGAELARAVFREPHDRLRTEIWNLVRDGERLSFLLDTDRAQTLAAVSVTSSSLGIPEKPGVV